MPKCCRLGWVLPFSPSAFETGVWKRLYIENIMALKTYSPKVITELHFKALHLNLHFLQVVDVKSMSQIDGSMSKMSLLAHMEAKGLLNTPRQKDTRPPWRGSDPVPKDTWRNNYLENEDEVQKVSKL
jgi:hypothetical protein